jgi:hypothetical protein
MSLSLSWSSIRFWLMQLFGNHLISPLVYYPFASISFHFLSYTLAYHCAHRNVNKEVDSLLIWVLHHDVESEHSVGIAWVMQCSQGAAPHRTLFSVKGKNSHGVCRVYRICSEDSSAYELKQQQHWSVCPLDLSKQLKTKIPIIEKERCTEGSGDEDWLHFHCCLKNNRYFVVCIWLIY